MQQPIEGPISHYMTDDAARDAAREIADAGGVEVFFVARRGRDGLIFEVEPHAYGTKTAVPVLMQTARPGEVILHNHPSGDLTPSEADLAIAAQLGQMSVGSFVINNDVTRARIIIRPHDARKKSPLDIQKIGSLLGPQSALAHELGEYEDRPQQRDMAGSVVEALNNDGIAVIEAGTGTGKSLAYLVPAVSFALENEERIIISTNTINLQEQILHKDLPLVRRAIDKEFTAEIVKGRSNYVCKRKAAFEREQFSVGQGMLIEEEFRAELRDLLAWAAQSATGDRNELTVPPRSEAWERIVSESDNTLRVRCPFYEECFFYNSRRSASRANVLVVNHSLLMSDLAVRRETNNWSAAAVLPPTKRVILDEAHHLEEVATDHLGSGVSRAGVRRLFSRLYRAGSSGRGGVLAGLHDAMEKLRQKGLVTSDARTFQLLAMDIMPRVSETRDILDNALEEFAYAFLELVRLDRPRKGVEHHTRITREIESDERWTEECMALVQRAAREMTLFGDLNTEAIKAIQQLPEAAAQELLNITMEWRALVERLDGQRRLLMAFLREDDRFCRWVELSVDRRDKIAVSLRQAPISVAGILKESLHDRMKTEILTSATLTVDRDFEYLYERVGLSRKAGAHAPPPPETDEEAEEGGAIDHPAAARPLDSVQLDTPFNYRDQVFFGVPDDLGDPRQPDFDKRLEPFICNAVSISGGRAFILFTSHGHMKRMHDACAPLIRRLGINCLVQGTESRDALLRRFREDETSVLFATSSFWEGVDVRGRALELLIIVKLPFAVPSEPISQAQHEWLAAQGRDPFNNLTVPRAIIRFKQGFGRLIRARTDRGAILIADERVVRMPYGRRFIRSLPEMEIVNKPGNELLKRMRGFFERK